ncbi:MAG: hypothetical protein M1837_007089 [Sclerophora amabilis]|nr:MAG: hypothetical protein M1837_007089 [Sclerophora amabilis]
MSSSASGPARGGSGDSNKPTSDRRQSLTKFMTKAKSVLRKDKRQSVSNVGESKPEEAAAAGSPVPATSEAAPATPAASAVPKASTAPKPTAAPKAPTLSTARSGEKMTATILSRSNLQEERARAMFEKYGLTLEPHEWTSPGQDALQRVSKPVRMRVHRSCHRCQTTYGTEKACSNCGHRRCKKCPRYPVKKDKESKDTGKVAGVTGVGAEAGKTKARSKTAVLTIPSQDGGQDRIRREVKQTVRRTCHHCEMTYPRGEKTCPGCGHVRCNKCPRDPSKLYKYPTGYPGDAEAPQTLSTGKQRTYRKPRMTVKWYCHSCDAVFISHTKTCEQCNHERCEECRRVPPKKIKPPPDPEVMRSVEAKLANVYLDE